MLMWQRPHDDVACSYTEVEVDDMKIIDWQMWMNDIVTRGIILVNRVVPRGPGMGATWHRCIWLLVQNLYGVCGDRTLDLTTGQGLCKVFPANVPHGVPCYIYVFLYI
jgi:hypothetical protein